MRLRGLIVLAAAAAARPRPGVRRPAPRRPPAVGTVGPGFTITLADADGSPVTQLDPGTYEIVVARPLRRAQLPPLGPGVDESTRRSRRPRTVTWTVTFARGPLHGQSATRTRRRCTGSSWSATRRRRADAAAAAGRDAEAARTVGPKNTISLAERERCGAASRRQGRHLLDRRPRPLEAAQLPSRRQGREPEVDGSPAPAR